MKRQTKLLLLGILASPILGNAQVNVSTSIEPRNAVLEEWTGIHCGYCPTGHAAVQAAVDNNPGRVVALNIHSGGYAVPSGAEPDYRTPEGDVHDGAFSISGYPSSTLNRRTIGGSQTYHPASSNSADKVPAVLAETSEVNIYVDATADMVTRVLTVDVEYYYTADAPNPTNYLNVAILQNNIQGPQTSYDQGNYNPGGWIGDPANGIYNHQHMFRGFMTGQWGDPINTTTTGSTAIMSYTMTLPNSINGVPLDIAEIEIAAYIGDGFESAGDVLTGSTVYPYLTGFPTNEEVIYISGNMPNASQCDAGTSISLSPEITIKNWGSNPMSSATVTYDVNGGAPQVYNFSDVVNPINPGQMRTITLDPISFAPLASNVVNVTVSDPNGVADNTADNSGTIPFDLNLAIGTDDFITIEVTTDDAADEFYMEVRSLTGTLIWSEGNENVQGNFGTGNTNPTADPTNPLANNTTYTWQVDFPWVTCYELMVYDYYGDGLSAGTAGSFDVKDNTGAIILSESAANFGSSEGSLVKVYTLGINEMDLENLAIYPNPATDLLHVEFNAEGEFTVALLDLQGRTIAMESGSDVSFPVDAISPGSYIVRIASENNVFTEHVVIK